MLRVLAFVIAVALLVAGAVWLAERPGEVTVQWQGWRIDTTVPVLLLGLVVLVAAFMALVRALFIILRAPRIIARARQEKRRRKGYLALIDGLSAVAAGDARQAQKKAQRADNLLRDPPLTMLLSAQAAQLSGDAEAAKKHFAAMLDRPETAFLGLRGLLTQALKEGDQAAALDYARRAHAVNPDADWLTATLFDLEARAGLWREAQETLLAAEKRGAFPPDEARRKRAVILAERARQMSQAGAEKDARKLLRQAQAADAAFSPAAVALADLYLRAGKPRKAAAVLEDAWRAGPHPEVARAYMELWQDEDVLHRVRRAETLAGRRPGDPDSHLVVAEASFEARLWGQARNHLLAAVEARPTARAYRLLAEVEQQETGDSAKVAEWLAKAAEAAPEPLWQCRQCGTVQENWSTLCPTCGAFDSIAWIEPPRRPAPPPQLPAAEARAEGDHEHQQPAS